MVAYIDLIMFQKLKKNDYEIFEILKNNSNSLLYDYIFENHGQKKNIKDFE